MYYYYISPFVIARQGDSAFTYQSDASLSIGQLVRIPLGKKVVTGIVLKAAKKPAFATKPIDSRLDLPPLPNSLIGLTAWMSEFYATHPAQVWQTLIPRGLEKNRRKDDKKSSHPSRKRTQYVLNSDQMAAIKTIMETSAGTSILHGVTGSGKTAVYIELAKAQQSNGRSTIIIVPEIALTAQLIAEFSPHFPDLILTHSTMTEAERDAAWRMALTSTTPRLVIGPRSALFLPLHDLGLIVIDEAHELSLKQEQSPKYAAARVAAKRAELTGSRLVLGSATPSVTDMFYAQARQRPVIEMNAQASANRLAPHVQVIDMTKKHNFTKHRFFSNALLAKIEHNLEAGVQSLLFHNRRGTAPMTICDNCGWSAACPRCFVPLTLHGDHYKLLCHICNHQEPVPKSCPECGNAGIIHKGIGTKLIETEIIKLFPRARIARFDGDTLKDASLATRYQALYDGDIDIIIGTQVVAKGLDLPHLRLVGVLQADSGLGLPDYLSAERVFQLISQVSGRVGRNEHESHVIVQSYQPDHPAVARGIRQDYQSFYAETIKERQRAVFPPFTHLLKLTNMYKTEAAAVSSARKLATELRTHASPDTTILGPTPAFYERVRDSYRWQLIIKSPLRGDLVELTKHVPSGRWQIDIDPASLL